MSDEQRAGVIRFKRGLEARLTAGGWESDDKDFARRLNAAYPYPPREKLGYDPDPLSTVTLAAGRGMGATEIKLPAPVERRRGVIY